MANDRLMNAAQGDSIITALQTIAQKSESPYHSGNKLNPAYIDTGALADGMTATTQSTDDDSTKLATTAFVHDVVDTLPTPMVYKGTLGTGGTITTLPVDGSANIGDVYKVITAGTYTSQEAKIGDIFICHTKTSDSNTWDYIPTGDDVDVTEVSAGIGLTTQSGSTITTTGTIKAKLQNETKLGADATIVSDPGSLTTNIQPVLTDNSGNLAVKVDKSDVGLGNVTNDAQVKKISSSTSGNIVTWGGTDGATVSDSGKAIATTFANNANQIPTGAAITSGVTGTATMTGYTIDPSSSPAAITTSDTINEAIGKLEKTTSINKNNILSVADQSTQYNYSSVSSMSGTSGFTALYYFDRPIPTGTYRLICTNVRTDTSKQCQFQVVGANASEQYTNLAPIISTANYVTNEFTTTFDLYGIKVYCNTPIEITNLAIIPKALYDAGFKSYQPYSLSNAELTAKEQVNENNILLLTANGGGKNLLNGSSPVRLYNATYSNGIVTQITDDTLSVFRFSLQGYSAPTTYVKLLNQVNTTKNGRIRLSFTKDNTFSIITIGHSGATEDCKIFFDISNLANGDYYAQINLINYQQSQGKYWFNELMIYDTKYDMLYQPYALSNAELTDNVLWNTNTGVKNLLSFDADTMKSINTGGTWSSNTWSLGNNVTLTINSDKSITLNGTANAGKTIYLTKNLGMTENAYTLSTGALTTKLWAGIIEVGGTENNYTGSTTHIDKTCQPNHITLYVESGCVLSNLTVYPMLTLKPLYDADPTYQSYAMSNAQLTNNISFVASRGRKNVLKFDSVGGGSSSGITYTFNDDGTVRASGTTGNAPSYAYLRINNSNVDAKKYTNGQFVLSGCPSGGGSDTYSLYAARGNYAKYDYGNGVILTPTSETEVSVVIRVERGQTVDIVFKPMIRLVGTDSTFEPYAMSNAELTAAEKQNESNILTGLTLVAHTSANGSTSLSYDTNINDFNIGGANSDKSSGSYLIICTNWSTTPAPYVGLLTFSGATTNNFIKTDVVTGFTPTITITQNISNATIAISGAAKISIYATK